MVHPLLLERDRARYCTSALKVIPALEVPFAVLQPSIEPLSMQLLDMDLGPHTWTHFRAWCLVRCSGMWPLSLYSRSSFAECLDICPLCGATKISVMHCLGECLGTACHFESVGWGCLRAGCSKGALVNALFGVCSQAEQRLSQVCVVGNCIHAVLSALPGDAEEDSTTDVSL